MQALNAKFKLISVISSTLDSWNVTADVVDNAGIFYAADVQLGDIVYCKGTELKKFRVTEISTVTGARFTGKLVSLDTIPIAPLVTDIAIIGTINNGMYTLPNGAMQGLDNSFIIAVSSAENIGLLQTIGTTLYVTGEPVVFDIFTKQAATVYPVVPKSVALYLRGQRLTNTVDYITGINYIELLTTVNPTDTYTVDYVRSDVV